MVQRPSYCRQYQRHRTGVVRPMDQKDGYHDESRNWKTEEDKLGLVTVTVVAPTVGTTK